MGEVFRTQNSGTGCRAQVVKLLHYFMGHVESAAAEFCTGKGKVRRSASDHRVSTPFRKGT
jgi:hypothetical protein